MDKKMIIKMALCKLGVGSNTPDTSVGKKKAIKDIKENYIKNMGVGGNMPSF